MDKLVSYTVLYGMRPRSLRCAAAAPFQRHRLWIVGCMRRRRLAQLWLPWHDSHDIIFFSAIAFKYASTTTKTSLPNGDSQLARHSCPFTFPPGARRARQSSSSITWSRCPPHSPRCVNLVSKVNVHQWPASNASQKNPSSSASSISLSLVRQMKPPPLKTGNDVQT